MNGVLPVQMVKPDQPVQLDLRAKPVPLERPVNPAHKVILDRKEKLDHKVTQERLDQKVLLANLAQLDQKVNQVNLVQKATAEWTVMTVYPVQTATTVNRDLKVTKVNIKIFPYL